MGGANGGLTRDGATWLVYLQVGVYATMLYGLSAALPILRAEQGASQAVAGLHGTALAVGTILCGASLGPLTRRFGRRRVVWTGLAIMNAAVLLIAALPLLPVTLAGYCLANAAGSLVLYAGMAALTEHHGAGRGAAAISEANAVAVTIGIGSTFLLSVLAQSAFGWRAGLLVPPIASVLLALVLGRRWVRERPAAKTAGRSGGALGARFQIMGMVLLCVAAVEFCFNLWGAELFARRTGLTLEAAATGLTAFTAGLAVGRFAGARLALRYAPAFLLVGALGVTGAGWLVFWLATDPVLGYAGLALSGLGVSLHFPMCVAMLGEASGGRTDLANARASLFAGVGVGAGPFVLGALADGFGPHPAFLIVPFLLVLAIAGVVWQHRAPITAPARQPAL
ncbi:putative MFS family arabinose efflux permease [Actinocorallia herbida]|uniref:Putative MFS family arabinose efflux permease n=1 Tax=Actinocorallia herbida TaxID=58109 RepID=A0A3N1CVM4_9ACTN|nr:MFS transporter [Actinocorallia herbida]ROO85353.1 putative MFS family arabinose efflux permease [Actinocorallia herbida]